MRSGRIIAALLAVMLCAVMFAAPASAAWKPPVQPLPDNVKGVVERCVAQNVGETAGMAVAVFSADEEIYSGCFGHINREKGYETGWDSVFEWGSVTKLTVWVSVMQLYEKGLIDLDADVREYLPEGFLKNLTYDKPVTMIDLMNHQGGFQETYYDIFVADGLPIEPLGELLSTKQPEQVFEPGTVTAYSNWGVALAGYIVECISGQEYWEYVNEHIFAPLAMRRTSLKPGYGDNRSVREQWDRLECYDADAKPLPYSDYHCEMYPAGSCASTIGDFELFARALLARKGLFEKPETYETLFTPTSMYPGTDYAKNCHGFWMIALGRPLYGHGGNTVGCSSYLLLDPENGVGAVVMTNQQGEGYYNHYMMEQLFGKYDDLYYFDGKRELPEDWYKPARNIFRNGFKMAGIGFEGFDAESRREFWVFDEDTGIVRAPYGDSIPASKAGAIGEIVLAGLWAVALVMCFVLLIIKLIVKLKKKDKRTLGTWAVTNVALQLVVLNLIVFAVLSALSYNASYTYTWVFPAVCAMLAAMIGLAVYGLVRLFRDGRTMKKGNRAFSILSLACLAVSIVNIIYWQIFVFWKF